jgi:aspartate carbamoyltransferase catalytic subunit
MISVGMPAETLSPPPPPLRGLQRQRTADFVPPHLISIRELSMEFISSLLQSADEMRLLVQSRGGNDSLKNKVPLVYFLVSFLKCTFQVLASIFYEPSTRTSCSFQAAMQRLGGTVICLNEDHSSVKKGESLEDTIRTMASYCDVIVLRHPIRGSAQIASMNSSSKPVINAGKEFCSLILYHLLKLSYKAMAQESTQLRLF